MEYILALYREYIGIMENGMEPLSTIYFVLRVQGQLVRDGLGPTYRAAVVVVATCCLGGSCHAVFRVRLFMG